MDFELTGEQRAFQDIARQFAADHLEPYAAEWHEKEVFPAGIVRQAAGVGFASSRPTRQVIIGTCCGSSRRK